MKKFLFLFILSITLFSQCKDKEEEGFTTLGDPFFSEEINETLDQARMTSNGDIDLSNLGYNHYLRIYRQKLKFQNEDWFLKSTNCTTVLDVTNKSLFVDGQDMNWLEGSNFAFYSFSSKNEGTIVNGVENYKLLENDFNKIPFNLTLGDQEYSGFFSEIEQLGDDSGPVINISKEQGHVLNWNRSNVENSKLILTIIHSTTTSTLIPLVPEKKIYIEDTGVFDISSELLSDYSDGDRILIQLRRELFFPMQDLLINASEIQMISPNIVN